MGRKIGYMIITWAFVILAYIILALMQSPVQTITTGVATEISASSNMTNYPGTLESIRIFPVIMWFIPGGVGIIATAVFLKQND